MKEFLKSPLGIGISVFVAVLVLSFFLKSSGFHIQNLNVVRGGDIAIASPQTSHKIFIDQKNITKDSAPNTAITLAENVIPGSHSVLVHNEIYWPWKKDIVVRSGETISIAPFLIRKNATGVIVTTEDPEYETLYTQVQEEALPTKEVPRTSKSGAVLVWADEFGVYAKWNGGTSTVPEYFCSDEGLCEQTITVLENIPGVRNVDFYKEREDVLMVSFSNGVFAIEIDKRGGTQNFQPIYKGAGTPRFIRADNQTIVVSDSSALFIIDL